MAYIDFIESISIILASLAAIIGISAWRKETRWKRKYELAEEVLAKFYEAHLNIKNIRSPFGYVNEGQSRKKSENETPRESEIYDSAYVVYERYEKNKEAIEKLQVLKFRFIAVFGKEHEKVFNDLIRVVNKIFFAAQGIARVRLGEYGELSAEERGKEIKEKLNIIYSNHIEENDAIEQEIKSIIKEIEIICRKIIGKK